MPPRTRLVILGHAVFVASKSRAGEDLFGCWKNGNGAGCVVQTIAAFPCKKVRGQRPKVVFYFFGFILDVLRRELHLIRHVLGKRRKQ